MSWIIQLHQIGKAFRGGRRLSNSLAESFMLHARTCLGRHDAAENLLWALKDVSFEVEEGEILGVMGRNGAGKSTLLKVLSRLTPPTTGEFRYKGRLASLLEIGTGFHGQLTGRENIFFNGSLLGLKRAEIRKKFDQIVAFSGVESFLDAPVKFYSSGMYTRLAFAVAAHLETDTLLVDEVLAVGDAEFQRKCMGHMGQAARSGRTVVLVSHSSSTIKALCTKGLLLEKGRMRSHGNVDAVLADYMSLHQVDGAEKEISTEDHVTGTDHIRIRRICLLNGVQGRFSVHWKQTIRVAFEFEVMRPLDEVAFGCSIRTVDHVPILTVHHDDKGAHPLWKLPEGRHVIEFTLTNELRPGLYRLHLGADQQHLMMKNLFSVETVVLEVLDHAEDGTVPLASQPGFVNGASHWTVPRRT